MLNVSGRILMVNKENSGNATENLVSIYTCAKRLYSSIETNLALHPCIEFKVVIWKGLKTLHTGLLRSHLHCEQCHASKNPNVFESNGYRCTFSLPHLKYPQHNEKNAFQFKLSIQCEQTSTGEYYIGLSLAST